MQINPQEVVKRNIISNIQNKEKQIQQVGIDLTLKDSVLIGPGETTNVLVSEKFNMQNCFGIINVRSSVSRMGVFTSSGIYDPGFNGVGGVSIYNMSKKTQRFEKGFRIGQVIVFKACAASQYNGIYNDKKTVESKYQKSTT